MDGLDWKIFIVRYGWWFCVFWGDHQWILSSNECVSFELKQTNKHTHTHGDAFPRKNHRSSHIDWRKVQWTVINGMNVFGVTILHRLFNESNSNERLHRCHNTMKFLIPYDFPNIAMAYELIHKWMYASQTTRTATTKFIKATFVWAC